jgi:putative intracellular protease/amidase
MPKVLIVTTSHDPFEGSSEGSNSYPTSVQMEEFALSYLELLENKIEITIASPEGGEMLIDPRSLPTPKQEQVWQSAIAASKQTVKLTAVKSKEFEALFLIGGHGCLFDLPDHLVLQQLLREFDEDGKIIAAVGHGLAGLIGATRSDGTLLVKDKVLTAYTNSEETEIGLDQKVPFILEQRLCELGATFIAHPNAADHVEQDGNLLTGQNLNSSASLARALVRTLNHQLPAIFDHTPEAIAPAQAVAEFPVNTFLENITIDSQGTIFVTSYEEGKIYRITASGECSEYAKINGNIAGIVIDREGNLIVAAAIDRQNPTILCIYPIGRIETLVTLPDAIFLNGMTHLDADRYLVADSYKGAIWQIDAIAKTAQIWIQNHLLARSNLFNPFPAVNGIKIYQNALFASNTQRRLLIRIPLGHHNTPGMPEVFLTNVNLDDFEFDARGNLYGTTHIYNSVIRISPEKQITIIAKAEQGVTGSTALAFGRRDHDCMSLYVTTNGGMSLPLPTGVETAKVIHLDVSIK